jgi:hypothetical protein
MKLVCYVLVAAGMIALALLGTRVAVAQSQPTPSYGPGGGLITGQVLGYDTSNLNNFGQFQPIVWANVTATNSQHTFVASTSSGGYYQMYVLTGIYNVTASERGYKPYSISVAVSDGSSSAINFNLEECSTCTYGAVPEFPTGMASTIAIVAITTALAVMKLRKRKR